MYQTEKTMNKIYPIGNSGIYINPNQLQSAVSGWIKNTPDAVKIKQVKQFATIGLIISAIVLIASIILQTVL